MKKRAGKILLFSILLLVSSVIFIVLMSEVSAIDPYVNTELVKIYKKGMGCDGCYSGGEAECLAQVSCPAGYTSKVAFRTCESSAKWILSGLVTGCFPTTSNHKCWNYCAKNVQHTFITYVARGALEDCDECYPNLECPSGYTEYPEARNCYDPPLFGDTECIKSCYKCAVGYEDANKNILDGCEKLVDYCASACAGKCGGFDTATECLGNNQRNFCAGNPSNPICHCMCLWIPIGYGNGYCSSILDEECHAGCDSSTGKCRCVDSDNGNEFVKGICKDKDTIEHEDKCLDEDSLEEWKCTDSTCTLEQIDCEYGCEDGACNAPPCEITKATATPLDCIGGECNVGDNINLYAEFPESCFVNYLEIAMSDDDKCNFNMSVGACDEEESSCSGEWMIPTVPEECRGKTVTAKSARVYDKDKKLKYDTNDPGIVSGGFKFVNNGALELQYVDLWPKDKKIDKLSTINYNLDAYYKEYPSNNIIKKDVTLHDLTNYTSSDETIASNSGQLAINIFKGLDEGTAVITGAFPVDLIHGIIGDVIKTGMKTEISSTSLTVKKNICDINELIIDDSLCSNQLCKEGENVKIGLEMTTSCGGAGQRRLRIDAMNLESECNFLIINNTIDTSKPYCEIAGTIKCDILWKIPQGFFTQYPKCKGKIATGYFAELNKSTGEWLDSKQGVPPEYFGSFKFWTENVLPVAKIIKPVGEGQVPVDGIPGFEVGNEIPFEDDSYDNDGTIEKWYWYYKKGADPWSRFTGIPFPLTTANHDDFNPFNYIFDLPGAYKVRLNVTDNVGAMDTDIKDFIITDDDTPIILVSSPEEGIIQNRTILLNVSETWNPPHEKEDKEGMVFSWQFDDNSVPATFENNWTYASKFTHVLKKIYDLYEFNLTVRDESANSDKTQLIFQAYRCGTGNSLKFADSQSESCYATKPLYCSSTGNCDDEGKCFPIEKCQVCGCPNGQSCLSSGHCETHTTSCEDNNEDDCLDESGCWWKINGASHCADCEVDKPSSCSSYKNSDFCNADKCSVGYETTAQGECGTFVTIGGIEYYIDCKGCSWNEAQEKCEQSYDLDPANGPGSQDCHESRIYDDCIGNYMKVTTNTECCSGQTSSNACGFTSATAPYRVGEIQTTETQQLCGTGTKPLPLFSWFNVITAIGILGIFYLFYSRRR